MIINDIDGGVYNGDFIKNRFGYRLFGKDKVTPYGNVVAFRSAVSIKTPITTIEVKDAVNFALEIPNADNYCGSAVHMLFNTSLASIIGCKMTKDPIEIDGAGIRMFKEHTRKGIILQDGTISFNVMNNVNSASMLHTGIILDLEDDTTTSEFVPLELTDDACNVLMKEGCDMFYGLMTTIFQQASKSGILWQ